MNIIYVLIPLSVLLMVLAIGAFFWAVKNDQFDDLDTPALDILDDDGEERASGERSLTPTNREDAKSAKDEENAD